MLFISSPAALHLLPWKQERWATPKLELRHTQRGHAETSEPPQGNRHDVISKPFLPPHLCPSVVGQGSRAKKILFCSTPFLAAQPNSSMEILAGNTSAGAVAWGIQPEAAQLLLEEAASHPLSYQGPSGSTDSSPIQQRLWQYHKTSPHPSPPTTIQTQDRGWGHLKQPPRESKPHFPPEMPLWSWYSCDLTVLKENYMSIGMYLSVGSLSFVPDIWFYTKYRCHLEQCQKSG